VETIKWQTRDACGYLAVRLQACVCGLSLQPIGCTSILSVMYSTAAAAVVASGAISVMPSPCHFGDDFYRLHSQEKQRQNTAWSGFKKRHDICSH